MSKLIDITNQRFGRLVAVNYVRKYNQIMWNCVCDCGGTKFVSGTSLRSGRVKDCGKCMKNERLKYPDTSGDVPYVEDFPKVYKIPDYMLYSLKEYGNTVVSSQLIKRLGWNGLQWHLHRYGYKVTVVKTEFNNYIVEVFNREKR